ncbi:hypothetical protein TTHERM_00404310 (macronuclear) [Tetrahymena thermophila SB210]|uniref:Uncharacterized protein n=1 Tax=Tetrahymena thermophila (strain SB210) TaxID=312017 RepID=I7M119_TETTS|nr:hypothetical protein TTHERM_00404310 [Tetrahymena thermophila SB210]EAR93861.1 hypothetical protein TTHERM_00404310 [Tetrahymena thermophila SB210]|eukprot:XP_001014106.1 hypothetical protein TTHERM_00404310 [Tetrahymena thermophila SB210]
MGRKKDQFIDKNKAITFKLSYRNNEDPFFQRQHEGVPVNVERVFEIKSIPMDNHLTEEEKQKRDKLLSLFTQEDQGIFEQKQKEQQQMNKFWVPPEIRKKLAGKDLWIDQLAQKSQLQEQEVEDYEIEELEEVEEVEANEDEQEEFTEEEEEGQEEEEEEIPTEKNQVKKTQKNKEEKKEDKDEEQNNDTGSEDYSYDGEEDDDQQEQEEQKEKEEAIPQKKIEDLTSQDFPDFKYKDLVQKKIVEDNIIPKYEKITFSKDVKFKKFNEYGLPASNFDYSKYFVQPSQQNDGIVEAVLLADYKTAPKLKEDIDYEYDEMTEEQREVFDALNYDIDDDAYEQLEDDFVLIANDGEQVIVEDLLEQEIEEEVTGQKKKKVKGKKINFTFDEEGKIQLELEKPKNKKVVKKVIKKYAQKDSKPGKDTVTEQDKEFDKVMKEMEDSYDEDKYNGSSDDDYDIPELKEGILTGEGFNKILDEHIAGMSQQEREQAHLEERKIKNKQVNVEFEQKQKERLEKYEGYFRPDEIVTRKIYQIVPLEKDNALKSYIERELIREVDPNYQENFDRPEAEFKLDETIATKNFSFSRVHENLTVIGGNDISLSKSKKYRPLKHADEDENKQKEKEVEQISENEEEQEEEDDEKDPLKIRSYELSKKIDTKNETKEEKAARKQALKEFKEARKQKKKLFKEGFEALAKEHQSKFQNRTNHHNIQNVKGISIKQMM